MPGHIFETLQIKFLILYLASRLYEPVPFETLLDLGLCDEGVNYFFFAEAVQDLVETGHLTCSDKGLYAVTEKGRVNSRACEDELPETVRMLCDQNLDVLNRELRQKGQVRTSIERRENGAYTLRLCLDDDMGSVLDMQVAVPREDMAQVFADRFQRKPERIFSRMMNILMDDGQNGRGQA